MKIYGIEKTSLVDYEGKMACTLFTAGCNFRCPFCHNSSLVEQLVEEPIPEEDIFAHLERRKKILEGVCITGGEPTLQHDLPQYIERIKQLGYQVKLDTNGTNPNMLNKLIEEKLIDYVAMDVKSGEGGYETASGVGYGFDRVQESIELLKKRVIDCEFRTTLVAELHDKSDIAELARLLEGAPKLYLQHFKSSKDCLEQGLNEVPLATAEEYRKYLSNYIETVKLRGY